MIDHMILDLQKYYKGQVPNYIGRKIKLPLKPIPFYGDPNPYNGTGDVKSTILEITEDGATATTTSGSFNYAGTICQVVIQTCGIVLNEGKDTKKINGTFQTFVCPRFLNDEQQNIPNSSSMPGWLCLSQIIENGGVSHSHLTHSYRAFHLVRKEISMALMKMKYQLKDWYQGKMQNYIGRSVTLPKTKIRFYDIHDSRDIMPSGSYTDCQHGKILGNTGTVNGQFFVGNDTFLTISFSFQFDYDEVHTVWLKLTDILQNGGVSSSSLTHLYQGLRHLLDRKVALAC